MKNHVMIDIETMGNVSNSAIVSIGAIKFDIESGSYGPFFTVQIDLDSCLRYGMKVTGDTIRWWLTRNQAAREEIADGENRVDIKVALEQFAQFLEHDNIVWSNGVRFDIAILEDAYLAIGLPIPWDFHNERDVRTLAAFAPGIKDRIQKEWTKTLHSALNDCDLQIKYCVEIYNKIKLI